MKNNTQELYVLEQLSNGNTCVHRLDPTVKLLTTAIFIITVVSFDKYAFGRLIPYIFYPSLMTAISGTPYSLLLKRFLIALPFCLFAGITNVIFDGAAAFAIGRAAVSYGVISFFTILFRTYLCVMAVLVLVSVTPLSSMTNSMRRLRVPYIFVAIFEMTYRYIGVLIDEAYSMYTAYALRSPGGKGIEMRHMGSFLGQLLLRCFDRADRIYNAMKCRGYALSGLTFVSGNKLTPHDLIFFAITCSLCAAFRFVNVNALYAGMFGGLA